MYCLWAIMQTQDGCPSLTRGPTFTLKIKKILVIGIYYVNYQNYHNVMLLTSSDTKRTLMQTPRHPSKVYITIMKTTCYWVFIVQKLFLVIGSNSNGPGSNGPEWNDKESNDKRSKTRQRVKRQGVKIEKKNILSSAAASSLNENKTEHKNMYYFGLG